MAQYQPSWAGKDGAKWFSPQQWPKPWLCGWYREVWLCVDSFVYYCWMNLTDTSNTVVENPGNLTAWLMTSITYILWSRRGQEEDRHPARGSASKLIAVSSWLRNGGTHCRKTCVNWHFADFWSWGVEKHQVRITALNFSWDIFKGCWSQQVWLAAEKHRKSNFFAAAVSDR